ncbi:MAG: phenylalanine--tRNA ligase subunit beta [Phycisphaerae bacterium]|nr:phenylalanine--tRNA ligase subunit beta [Phycisphaerae bacterium]
MPVAALPVDVLLKLLPMKLQAKQLVRHLEQLGCDVEGYTTVGRFRCESCGNVMESTSSEQSPAICESCGCDFRAEAEKISQLDDAEVIRVELLSVRPDLFDPGGLARALRGYLGVQKGLAKYELSEGKCSVEVDESTRREKSRRPFIACAIVRGIELDETLIKIVMKLQENLHWALGRDRKHASIGVYDLDKVCQGQFSYRTVGPSELSFVPLGMDEQEPANKMTPGQVLEKHPKGVAFAHLLAGFDRYPLLADEQGVVMSMPPIINSQATRVRKETKNFFMDVTGTGQRVVNRALNIMVCDLMELCPKAVVEKVLIKYTDGEITTPDLEPQQMSLDAAAAAKLIGVELSTGEVAQLLAKMGHGVEDSGGPKLKVSVPAYRNDILHERDLVEDVAIAYGYENIEPSLVKTMTVGQELAIEGARDIARQTLIGLGCYEVMTLPMTSAESAYEKLGLAETQEYVEVENPISVAQTMLRTSLLAGLLETLSLNTHHDMPQQIFEVGEVTLLDKDAQTGASEYQRVAVAVTGSEAGFAQLRSIVESLAGQFKKRLTAEPLDIGLFTPGRGAKLLLSKGGSEPVCIGQIGEVHPAVLERFKLTHATAVFEVDLEALAN